MLAYMLSPTDSICLGDGGTDGGSDGKSSLDLLRDKDGNSDESSGYQVKDEQLMSKQTRCGVTQQCRLDPRLMSRHQNPVGDLDNSTSNILIPLDSWTSGLLVYKLPLSVKYGVSTSIGYGVSSFLSNTVYSSQQINTTYPLPLDTAYRSSDKILFLRMKKVIKGEFEKIKDVKVEDVPLTCDASLEVFNNEVSRLGKRDDDLFTYEVEVANIPCDSKMNNDSEQDADDDMGYDPSDVALIEWLGSKIFNYKTMDHYTIKALWIYWIKGDDEVEITDEESSSDEDDIAEVFRIDTNIFDYETPLCSAFKEFNYLLEDVPWVDEKPWTDTGVWTKPTPVKHTFKPFNYKTGCLEWPTCNWKDDGYCNGGNLPGTYIIENQLYYQDYEWYEALEDSELKDEALRNKAIMEGSIKEDDDESRYEQKR
ncbi:hypothetical protein Tco_1229239 [Tanacetum coccineum]